MATSKICQVLRSTRNKISTVCLLHYSYSLAQATSYRCPNVWNKIFRADWLPTGVRLLPKNVFFETDCLTFLCTLSRGSSRMPANSFFLQTFKIRMLKDSWQAVILQTVMEDPATSPFVNSVRESSDVKYIGIKIRLQLVLQTMQGRGLNSTYRTGD